MPTKEDIRWLKQQFQPEIEQAVKGTPFSVDMLVAVACQETGYIWQRLRRSELNLSRAKILELCVGDVIDHKPKGGGRTVFPLNKQDLIKAANGQQMFDLAHQALVDMAVYIKDYQPYAKNANKFCHGFGIFQFDIQHFRTKPDYFLEKRYADFGTCLARCVDELRGAMKGIGLNKPVLTDLEMAYVAIAYNIGPKNFRASKGLKQGFRPKGGRFYGEEFFDFLRTSKTVGVSGQTPAPIPAPEPGQAAVSLPAPVEAGGPTYEVDVRENPLRVRSEPKIDKNGANVIGKLPDGHIVKAVTNKKVNGFLEVETSLAGAHLRGFAFAKFLKPAAIPEVPVVIPAAAPPTSGIVEVIMPRKPGTVTKRVDPANALSLNEKGQPGRKGTTPAELCSELIAIVDWLAVDHKAHLRYQPHGGSTFCNIYAHDYCYLAGVYLPRVWWTPGAIEKLAQGQHLEPKLENTIEEVRANGLFRWLRDFGPRFGWRQTGTLTKLQVEVNQGAIGIIVARRKNDGLSGHIAAVIPEFDAHTARRDATGEAMAPLQSQAGRTNFRYGRGGLNWWKGQQFAESAFWLHA